MKYKKLQDFLFKYVQLNNLEWFFCEQFLQISTYQKGEIIHFAGDVCNKLIYVNSGILRSYILDGNGNDYTWEICFNDENAKVPNLFVIDYDSFTTKTPSQFSIEVLEDCELLWISHDILQKLYTFNKKYERLGRLLVEDGYVYAQRRVIDMTINTATERYETFARLHGHIVHKIPQYHIASYLKMTPQHLSAIKQKLKILK